MARLIKASEIGAYVFCRRSWWLHQVAGAEPSGAARRARGTQRHLAHGRQVWLSQVLLVAGLILLVAALLLR